MEEGWEGCLSVPGLRGAVSRHRRIRYQGLDPQGTADRPQRRRVPCAGGAARVRPPDRPPVSPRITDFSKFGFTEVLFPEPGPRRGRLSGCARGSRSGLAQLRGGVPSGAAGACFSLVSPGVSPGRFSAVSYEFPFFAFSPLLLGVHLPTQHLRGAPDGRWRPRRRTAADASSIMRWRSAWRGRRSTALSATGVVR